MIDSLIQHRSKLEAAMNWADSLTSILKQINEYYRDIQIDENKLLEYPDQGEVVEGINTIEIEEDKANEEILDDKKTFQDIEEECYLKMKQMMETCLIHNIATITKQRQ